MKREYLPESACPEGAPRVSRGKVQEEPACPWWINSPAHNYCFWRYVKDKSDEDGVMRELVQTDLAELFGWSATKTHFVLKQAMVELTDALKTYGAIDLLRDIDVEDTELEATVADLLEFSPPEPIE